MGLLSSGDWKARWIEAAQDEGAKASQPAPVLRGTFAVKGKVRSARAYVTSLGLYELEINGKRVGDQLFTPGWTSYHHRLQYQTYDVTGHLRAGENAIGAMLGDGWYRGFLAWKDKRAVYGDRLALLCQLRIEYADGRTETVGTGETWKSTTGPIRSSDIYNGETYDARLERPGWSAPGHPDADWAPVVVVRPRERSLVAPAGPPVRRIEEIRPVKVLKTPAGETVVDMGQNMVGHVRLKVQGPGGDDGDPAPRRGARQGRQLLHRQPPRGEAAGEVHAEGRRRRGVRAALHVPGLPLRGGRGLAGRADPRRPHRRRRPLGHAGRPGASPPRTPS